MFYLPSIIAVECIEGSFIFLASVLAVKSRTVLRSRVVAVWPASPVVHY